MIVADRIINQSHTLLVGPLTTAWEFNLLPPTYYYIIAALLAVTGSELGITVAFTAASTVSIILIYYFTKHIFDTKTGLVAAFIWAFSTEMIWYGRNFWEPHLVPFFMVISLIALVKAEKTNRFVWLLLSHIAFAASFVYVSPVLLLPGYLWLVFTIGAKLGNRALWGIISVVTTIMILAVFYLPVYIFEASHEFPSVTALTTVSGSTSGGAYLNISIKSFTGSVIAHIWIFLQSLGLSPLILTIILFAVTFWEISKTYIIVKHRQWLTRLIVCMVVAFLFTGIYGREPQVFRMASLYPIIIPLLAFIMTAILSQLRFHRKHLNFSVVAVTILTFMFMRNNATDYANIVQANDYYHYTEILQITRYIKNQSIRVPFTIYSITPIEKSNHHGSRYFWTLEKLTGLRYAKLNTRGNWIEQSLNKNVSKIFLVCSEFNNREDILNKCLEYFLNQQDLPQPVAVKEFSDSIVYTILQ